MHHHTDRITHTKAFVTPVVEREIAHSQQEQLLACARAKLFPREQKTARVTKRRFYFLLIHVTQKHTVEAAK